MYYDSMVPSTNMAKERLQVPFALKNSGWFRALFPQIMACHKSISVEKHIFVIKKKY